MCKDVLLIKGDLFQLAIHSSSELSTALFSSRRDVQRYEKAFHEEVYLPVLKDFRKEVYEYYIR